MRADLLVLVCLACVGHARRTHSTSQRMQDNLESAWKREVHLDRKLLKSRNAEGQFHSAKALALFFSSLNPAASFNPPGGWDARRLHHRKSSAQMIAADAAAFEAFRQGDETQGLAARDDVVGTGDVAKKGDVVVVEYTGRLMDESGKQFDAGNIAFELGAGRVILGWEKGLEGMRVGGKRTLRIPSRLGYGARGAGMAIPPNSDLEFDCELKKTASGAVAKLVTQLDLGLNVRTVAVVFLLATFLFPDFFNQFLGR